MRVMGGWRGEGGEGEGGKGEKGKMGRKPSPGPENHLAIHRQVTNMFEVHTDIPQGSLSPILYLFYNADLLDICERPGMRTSG